MSARYFQAADHQLSTETGEIRLTSVQARLCQCFYLLSQSRVNHCWSLFGTTAHLILAIGIHRKRRIETSNGFDLIELECRKRVFWCAYSLDNYLSAALGRPRTFHDDDIDQDFPTCVNDSDLSSHRMNSTSTKAQSIMMAPVAHARLVHSSHTTLSISQPCEDFLAHSFSCARKIVRREAPPARSSLRMARQRWEIEKLFLAMITTEEDLGYRELSVTYCAIFTLFVLRHLPLE